MSYILLIYNTVCWVKWAISKIIKGSKLKILTTLIAHLQVQFGLKIVKSWGVDEDAREFAAAAA